jgi:exonuclease SbcC
MLTGIRLQNFQSHKETNITFSPGITAITGSSDSGKTAILRGLYWLAYNRPAPGALISHWALKGDKQTAAIRVAIHADDAEITRIRNKDTNGYVVNGKSLNAVRSDVPEDVSNALRMDMVNIQRQLDAPFLLADSPGEVARVFNRTVRLDIIDRVLKNADRARRDLTQKQREAEQQKIKLESDLEKLNWVSAAAAQLEIAEDLIAAISRAEGMMKSLTGKLVSIKDAQTNIGALEKWLKVEPVLKKYLALLQAQEDQQARSQRLRALLRTSYQADHTVKRYPDFERLTQTIRGIAEIAADLEKKRERHANLSRKVASLAEAHLVLDQIPAQNILQRTRHLLDTAMKLRDALSEHKNAVGALTSRLNDITSSEEAITTYAQREADLKQLLPQICPTCNQQWSRI